MVVVVAVVGLWSAFAAAFVFAGLVHCLALGRFARIPYLDVVSCSQRLLELNRRLLLSGSHIVADVLGHIALLGTLLAMLIWRSYIRIIKEARLEINSSPVFDIKQSKEPAGLGMGHEEKNVAEIELLKIIAQLHRVDVIIPQAVVQSISRPRTPIK